MLFFSFFSPTYLLQAVSFSFCRFFHTWTRTSYKHHICYEVRKLPYTTHDSLSCNQCEINEQMCFPVEIFWLIIYERMSLQMSLFCWQLGSLSFSASAPLLWMMDCSWDDCCSWCRLPTNQSFTELFLVHSGRRWYWLLLREKTVR